MGIRTARAVAHLLCIHDLKIAPSRSRSSSASHDAARLSLAYCIQQVRTADHANYIWCAQLPKELRPAVFALRAFNVETGLVSDNVKEYGLRQIRFQWWRDAVNSILTDKPVKHPVIESLAQVRSLGLPGRYHLQRMVSAREADALSTTPPQTSKDLEEYAEGTASQLQFLQCKVAAAAGPDVDHAASHLGKAVGITALLRGTVHHARRRRSYLPIDLCAKEGVSQEDLYRGQASEALNEVVFQIASIAKGHLDQAQTLCAKLPAHAVQMMMPAVATGLYLKALEKHQFNVFEPKLQGGGYSQLWYQLRLKYCMIRHKF